MDRDINLILAEYVDTRQAGNPPSAADLVKQYPEHAEEILAFTLYREAAASCEPVLTDDPAAGERFAATATRVMERMRAAETSGPPLRSIIAAAKAQGMDSVALAKRLGLSFDFVAKLNRCLFLPASIPARLVGRLADALGRTADEIAVYLAGPARLSPGLEYKAKQAPEIESQEDFRQAIMRDAELDAAQRAEWLAEE